VSERRVGECKEVRCVGKLADCSKYAEVPIRRTPVRGLSTVFVSLKGKLEKWCCVRHRYKYEVWQKSNETDFLLTMNFILFTNQGYPLQNSSLGQLHSDGGVVSIVRNSVVRLLLEYLSSPRLRSSGYYPKYQNGALSSGF